MDDFDAKRQWVEKEQYKEQMRLERQRRNSMGIYTEADREYYRWVEEQRQTGIANRHKEIIQASTENLGNLNMSYQGHRDLYHFYSIHNSGVENTSVTMTDWLAGEVSNVAKEQYNFFKRNNPKSGLSITDYFNQYPQAYQQVMNQPMNQLGLLNMKQFVGAGDAEAREIGKLRSVGDAVQYLFRANTQGFTESAVNQQGRGLPVNDKISHSALGFFQNVLGYNPAFKTSFTQYIQNKSLQEVRAAARREAAFNSNLSLDAPLGAGEDALTLGDVGTGQMLGEYGYFENKPIRPADSIIDAINLVPPKAARDLDDAPQSILHVLGSLRGDRADIITGHYNQTLNTVINTPEPIGSRSVLVAGNVGGTFPNVGQADFSYNTYFGETNKNVAGRNVSYAGSSLEAFRYLERTEPVPQRAQRPQIAHTHGSNVFQDPTRPGGTVDFGIDDFQGLQDYADFGESGGVISYRDETGKWHNVQGQYYRYGDIAEKDPWYVGVANAMTGPLQTTTINYGQGKSSYVDAEFDSEWPTGLYKRPGTSLFYNTYNKKADRTYTFVAPLSKVPTDEFSEQVMLTGQDVVNFGKNVQPYMKRYKKGAHYAESAEMVYGAIHNIEAQLMGHGFDFAPEQQSNLDAFEDVHQARRKVILERDRDYRRSTQTTQYAFDLEQIPSNYAGRVSPQLSSEVVRLMGLGVIGPSGQSGKPQHTPMRTYTPLARPEYRLKNVTPLVPVKEGNTTRLVPYSGDVNLRQMEDFWYEDIEYSPFDMEDVNDLTPEMAEGALSDVGNDVMIDMTQEEEDLSPDVVMRMPNRLRPGKMGNPSVRVATQLASKGMSGGEGIMSLLDESTLNQNRANYKVLHDVEMGQNRKPLVDEAGNKIKKRSSLDFLSEELGKYKTELMSSNPAEYVNTISAGDAGEYRERFNNIMSDLGWDFRYQEGKEKELVEFMGDLNSRDPHAASMLKWLEATEDRQTRYISKRKREAKGSGLPSPERLRNVAAGASDNIPEPNINWIGETDYLKGASVHDITPRITDNARSSISIGFTNLNQEEIGLLVGKVGDEGTVISRVLKAKREEIESSSRTHVRPNEKFWSNASSSLEDGETIVGTVHTHPGLNMLHPSQTDIEGIMNPQLWQPSQVHMIYDPTTREYTMWGNSPEEGGQGVRMVGFKGDIVPWRDGNVNLQKLKDQAARTKAEITEKLSGGVQSAREDNPESSPPERSPKKWAGFNLEAALGGEEPDFIDEHGNPIPMPDDDAKDANYIDKDGMEQENFWTRGEQRGLWAEIYARRHGKSAKVSDKSRRIVDKITGAPSAKRVDAFWEKMGEAMDREKEGSGIPPSMATGGGGRKPPSEPPPPANFDDEWRDPQEDRIYKGGVPAEEGRAHAPFRDWVAKDGEPTLGEDVDGPSPRQRLDERNRIKAARAQATRDKSSSAFFHSGERFASQLSAKTLQQDDFRDSFYGRPRYRPITDAKGEIVDTEIYIGYADTENISPQRIATGVSIAKEAVTRATRGPMPTNASDQAATIRERINSVISEQVNNYIKDLTDAGYEKPTARIAGEQVETVTKALAKSAENRLLQELHGDSSGYGGQASWHSQRLYKLEDIEKAMIAEPEFAAKVKEMGGAEKLHNLGMPTSLSFTSSAGGAGGFTIVGGGDSGGRGGGRDDGGAFQSMWNSPMGRVMYAGYLTQRLWNMSAGRGQMLAEKYEQYENEIFGMAGDGPSAFNRRQWGDMSFAKGANDVFGGGSDLKYLLGSYGGAIPRLTAFGQVATGLAGGALTTGFMMDQLGVPGGKALAGAAGKIGLYAFGAGVALEGANAISQAFGGPEITPRAAGNTFNKLVAYTAANFRSNPWDGWATPQELWDNMTLEEKAIMRQNTSDPERDEIASKSQLMGYYANEDPITSARTVRAMKAQGFDTNEYGLQWFGQRARALGTDTNQLFAQGVSVANQMGFVTGTSQSQSFAMDYAGQSLSQQYLTQQTAARMAGIGSSIQSYMPADATIGGVMAGQAIAQQYGIQDQMQVGQATSMIGAYRQMGGSTPTWMVQSLAGLSQMQSPYATSTIASAMTELGRTFDPYSIAYNMAGMTNDQARMFQPFLSGDLRGMSFFANRAGDVGNQFFDMSGNQMSETNGLKFMMMARTQAHGIPEAADWAKTGDPTELLGTSNPEIIDAFMRGGTRGLEAYSRQKSYENQEKSLGNQFAQIALTEQFYWGSGSWASPSAGSLWGIQDRQIDLQRQSQEAGFAMTERRMAENKAFDFATDEITTQRMNTTQGYNLWTMDFNRMASLQQRGWTQEDWGYQDQMRSLNYGWQMEDFNTNIRFASGRDRKQLIKQRDRAALTESIESEHIEEGRDRQKQVWAQEDERYRKQKEYTLELNKLDRESFDLNRNHRENLRKMDEEDFARSKKEYEENKKLDDELRELQRKHTHDQLELQKGALGISAEQIKQQKEINEVMIKSGNNIKDLYGVIKNVADFDKAEFIMRAFISVMEAMGDVDVDKWERMMRYMKGSRGGGGGGYYYAP